MTNEFGTINNSDEIFSSASTFLANLDNLIIEETKSENRSEELPTAILEELLAARAKVRSSMRILEEWNFNQHLKYNRYSKNE